MEHGRSSQELHAMRPFILTYFPSVPTHLAANRLTLGLYNALYGTDL